MTRKQALDWIRIYCAEDGRISDRAFRCYIENRVSFSAFKEAAAIGLKQHEALASGRKFLDKATS